MLEGLRVVVDVQHLYRPAKPRDRGSVYRLANGTTTTEGSAALAYASALRAWLAIRGASVLSNDPLRGILVGPYSTRHRAVNAWGCHAYLACHLNAGGGHYALMEHMSMTEGNGLAKAMGESMVETFSAITSYHTLPLRSTDRGAVCIERVESPAVAVLCEPFFGDCEAQQGLLGAVALVSVGEALGRGVATWWASRPPIA